MVGYLDAEIEKIRDDLNALAELAFETWLKEKKQKNKPYKLGKLGTICYS